MADEQSPVSRAQSCRVPQSQVRVHARINGDCIQPTRKNYTILKLLNRVENVIHIFHIMLSLRLKLRRDYALPFRMLHVM
jgi:hypothetical protein